MNRNECDNYNDLLIDLVQQYEFLYNKNKANYNNIVARDAIWEEIARRLEKEPKDVKRRWITIRDRYSKEIRRIETAEKANKRLNDVWHYYFKLSFLAPFMKRREKRLKRSNEDAAQDGIDESHPDNNNRFQFASPISSCQDSNDSTESKRFRIDCTTDAITRDQRLIELVKENTILYSKKAVPQKQELKESAWHQIANQMKMDVKSCRQRWENLRDYYTREVRRLNTEPCDTPKWPLYESMEFLREFIVFKHLQLDNIESVDIIENDIDNTEDEMKLEIFPDNEANKDICLQSLHDHDKFIDNLNLEADNTFEDSSFGNEILNETQNDCTKSHPKSPASSMNSMSNERIKCFVGIVENKLKILERTLQNKAMKDILQYCNAIENYQIELTDKMPTFVLSCPTCDMRFKP